jgi:5-methylcytosine-specific restriction endonuclease McrA
MVRNTAENNKRFQEKTVRQLQNKHGTLYCSCGCGEKLILTWHHLYRGIPKYISGHNNTGKTFTKIHRENMSKSMNKGKTRLIILLRTENKYKEWRNKVFKRDNYTCQISGINDSGKLEAHHIKQLSIILKENNISTIKDAYKCDSIWDINNGITLNKSVHYIFHKLYGKLNTTKEQLMEFKNGFPRRISTNRKSNTFIHFC